MYTEPDKFHYISYIFYISDNNQRSIPDQLWKTFKNMIYDVDAYWKLFFMVAHTDNVHYNDVKMSAISSQITSLTSVYSTV